MIINKSEQEKREAIVAHANKSIFVEAGAGAGKTTLIVQRVTNQIRQGFIKPEELVVITFTNKAAGELFERIRKSFENEEKNPDNTQEQKDRFTYAIEHIEQIHISTIHSFCFSLLRERCFDSKLPLEVSLLENNQNINRQKAFFAKWFAKLDRPAIDEIKKAITLFKGNSFYYGEKLEEVFIKICEKPDDVNLVSLSDTQLYQLETEINNYIMKAETLLQDINKGMAATAQKGIEIYERHTGEPFDAKGDGLKLKKFYEYVDGGFPGNGSGAKTYNDNVKKLYSSEEILLCNKGKKKAQIEAYAKANEEFGQWLDDNIRRDNLYEEWYTIEQDRKEKITSYVYYVLIKYAIKARISYLKELDNDKLSNEQLIQKAKNLVCTSGAAHSYFTQKYKCFYVDEFQDTDHIQAELVWKLASDNDGKLKPGALFVVGDPKQAIYRFRGGEPAVYYQIKERMTNDNDAEVYELDYNFRSNKEIIDWVNKQFKAPVTGSGITYRDMECVARNYVEESDTESNKDFNKELNKEVMALKGVYYFNTLGNNKFKSSAERAEHEAKKLASLIKKLVVNSYRIYRTAKSEKGFIREPRPINYGDFLILCWDTTQMDYYIEAMKALAIPVDLAGKTDIDGSYVLQSFLSLFRFLVQPWDEKSRQGAGHIISRKIVSVDREEMEQRLDYLHENVKHMNCYGKAQFLLQHIEYILPWDVIISKEDMYSIQARLHQMVENVFSQAKEEPEQIIKYFEDYISNKLERELMLTEDKSAVRFMNLHKAKGLEGNITILTNRKPMKKDRIPEYTSSERNANQQYDYYGCISDKFSSLHGYDYDTNSKQVLERAQAEENAEKIRLEYVAKTRAKEVLIITEEYGKDAPFSGYDKPEQDIEGIFHENDDVAVGGTEEVNKGVGSALEEVSQEAQKAVYISLSPSELEGITRDNADENYTEDFSENDIEKDIVKGIGKDTEKATAGISNPLPRRPKGNIFGTTMHRSFELFIRQEGDVSVCVAQAIIENYDDLLREGVRRYLEPNENKEVYIHAVKEYLEGILHKFSADETMNTLLSNAKEIYTELPFSYYDSPKDNQELFDDIRIHLDKNKIRIDDNQMVWINGTADLVVIDAQGFVHIIDFKSDTNHEATVEEFEKVIYDKYKGQLLLYKYAMKQIFGVELEKISAELYHLYK